MDYGADPHFYADQLSQPTETSTPEPVPVPLPPIQLPSAPRPSLSPSVSRVFQRPANDKAPTMTGGLDLSQPANQAGYGRGSGGMGGGDSLEDDIARSRAARASRLAGSSTPSSPSLSSAGSTPISARTPRTDFDPRDSASARANINALASAGQANLSGGQNGGGSAPSLAMFMGGGGQRRVHKVNQGMTEAEKEETERLEKEMEATRAKWGNKENSAAAGGPPAGGMSLAALMMGGKTPSAAAPAQRAQTLPADAPSSQTPAPQEVEAKVVSRSPPPVSDTAASAPPEPVSTDFAPSSTSPPPAQTGSGPSSNTATLTRLRSSSIVAERLRSAEALAGTGTSSSNAASSSPAPSAPSSPAPDKADKRRSVLDRWGRDEPNLSGVDALRSPPLGSGSWSTSPKLEEKEEKQPERQSETEKEKEKALDSTASPALIAVANKVEASRATGAGKEADLNVPVEKEDEGVKVEDEGVAPKLIHLTQSRARPTKSTPRTLSSTASASEAATPSSPSLVDPSSPAPDTPQPQAEETPKPSGSGSGGYTKPTWSAAPIGVKPPSLSPNPSFSSPSAGAAAEDAPEVKHTRGVALPGLSSAPSLRSTASPAPSRAQTYPQPAPSPSVTPAPAPAAASTPRSSVKNVAMRWGAAMAAQDDEARREKEERARRIKESYGVKVAEPTSPVKARSTPLPVQTQAPASAPVRVKEPKRDDPKTQPLPQPVPVVQPSAAPAPSPTPVRAPQAPKATFTAAPAASASKKTPSVLLSLLSSAPPPAHLPPTRETLDLSVFHLNAPAPSPRPIEHNFMLFRDEIFGVVYRFLPSGQEGKEGEGQGEVRTKVWVWRGDEAREGEKTQEMVKRLRDKTGVREKDVEEVVYRQESPEFAEAFEGQVTVCRGNRNAFDHLATRIFSVQAHDGVIYVEEADVSSRSLSSAFSTVFSSPSGQVFAWLGEFSPASERQACCEFAESIADGREVEVLEEGEESALFWHSLDGLEYASAYYWRYRPTLPPSLRPSVLHFPSTSPTPLLSPSLALSPTHISLLDAPGHEIWVVVPSLADAKSRARKSELHRALEAAEELAWEWESRGTGAEGRTPVHVIAFPSLLPRDLPFLSRQLDFSALNASAPAGEPTKMNVYTVEEARAEFLS
ncbi:hypothetical protein JCM6882_004852 [Rhodosporidiobolus microsporus]